MSKSYFGCPHRTSININADFKEKFDRSDTLDHACSRLNVRTLKFEYIYIFLILIRIGYFIRKHHNFSIKIENFRLFYKN